MEKFYDVGKVVNTQGLKGEVRVISSTDFADERFKKGATLYLFRENSEPIALKVASHRVHKNFNMLTFEGYNRIEEVEPFRGGILRVSETQLEDLSDHEFYYHEIIGLSVVSDAGEELGIIKEILPLGANDVWVVSKPGRKDLLVPYIASVVEKVSLEDKQVTIHILEGMMD
jgi:16S rRNA processing protein RimM